MTEPFGIEVAEGHVAMKLSGVLDDSNFAALKGQIEEAKRIVKREYDRTKSMQRVLFDLTDFSGTYNVPAMLAFKDLEATNRPYVAKTAIFGGSPAARVAAELTIELIGHPSLKMFTQKEEALAWLAT